jgi:hypothetical protein
LDLEALLTDPEGFGLVNASPVQRAVCRIMTGEPLEELAELDEVAAIVGGAHALAALPTTAPRVVCFGAAVRCGKSTISAAKALRNAYLGDCSGLAPGEVPRVNIVSVDLDKSRETFDKLVGALTTSPHLAPLLIGRPGRDSVMVRNHSGWPVEIKMIAGSRAGQTLISRWCLGAIFDEAPRMLGQADGVVNLNDALTALKARMRPGAQIDLVGSLWAPRGPVFELVQRRFGKPGEDVVVIIATGPQLRPDLYTPEYCDRIRVDDDRTFESDVMARFADPEDALLHSVDVAAAMRADEHLLTRVPGQQYVAVMDPATRGNGWTLVVLTSPAPGRYEVVLAREWTGSRQQPLRASIVLREMADVLAPYEVFEIYTDQWGFDILTDVVKLLEEHGEIMPLALLQLDRDDDVASKGAETLFGKRALSLPANTQLRSDLIAVKKKPRQQGGFKVEFPKTADGRHCDFGAALLLAMQTLPEPPTAKVDLSASEDEQRVLDMLNGRIAHPGSSAAESILSGNFF